VDFLKGEGGAVEGLGAALKPPVGPAEADKVLHVKGVFSLIYDCICLCLDVFAISWTGSLFSATVTLQNIVRV
jgi:hypothetical protein